VADPRTSGLRRRLGAQLRVVRSQAGLSGYQLARRLPFTQSKISRIETGDLWPKLAEIARWLDVCGVTDPAARARVLGLAEAIESGLTSYRDVQRGSLETRQRELIDIDSQARLVRQYHPVLLTGPFHSADYARACIEAANLAGLVDVDAAVAARLERGKRLRDGRASRYHAIMSEAALWWTPAAAPHSVRQSQQLLLDATGSPHITVQVLPTGAPQTALTQCGFFIVDWRAPDETPIVIVETPAIEVTITNTDEVAEFNEVWRRLAADALQPDQTQRLLATALATAPHVS
jgi:transcriptional regulator with XRE-family HTH domain